MLEMSEKTGQWLEPAHSAAKFGKNDRRDTGALSQTLTELCSLIRIQVDVDLNRR